MKKPHGFVYTLFAIAVVASVMMLLSVQSIFRPEVHVAEKIRSDEMTYLEDGIFSDLERGAHISAQRAILAIINSTLALGVYNTTSNESIKDIMMTGSYNGSKVSLMENTTIANWTTSINLLASSLGYGANITVLKLRITHENAFSINVSILAQSILSDKHAEMQLDRSKNISTLISVNDSEDTFVAIESKGYAKQQIRECNFTYGTGGTTDWAWGRTYIDPAKLDYDGLDKTGKILVVDTLAGRSNYTGFEAIISENSSDSPPGKYIAGVAGATSLKNGALVAKHDETLWITDITTEPVNSCYFGAPAGPSFLDRLEGAKTLSTKYNTTGANIGIGSFIYVPGLPPELQKGTEDYALDYEYFA